MTVLYVILVAISILASVGGVAYVLTRPKNTSLTLDDTSDEQRTRQDTPSSGTKRGGDDATPSDEQAGTGTGDPTNPTPDQPAAPPLPKPPQKPLRDPLFSKDNPPETRSDHLLARVEAALEAFSNAPWMQSASLASQADAPFGTFVPIDPLLWDFQKAAALRQVAPFGVRVLPWRLQRYLLCFPAPDAVDMYFECLGLSYDATLHSSITVRRGVGALIQWLHRTMSGDVDDSDVYRNVRRLMLCETHTVHALKDAETRICQSRFSRTLQARLLPVSEPESDVPDHALLRHRAETQQRLYTDIWIVNTISVGIKVALAESERRRVEKESDDPMDALHEYEIKRRYHQLEDITKCARSRGLHLYLYATRRGARLWRRMQTASDEVMSLIKDLRYVLALSSMSFRDDHEGELPVHQAHIPLGRSQTSFLRNRNMFPILPTTEGQTLQHASDDFKAYEDVDALIAELRSRYGVYRTFRNRLRPTGVRTT